MKKVTLLSIFILSIFIAQAQVAVDDSTSLGPGYTTLAFYKLSDGSETNPNAKDWDLQIMTEAMDVTVRTNDGASAQLYALHHGDDTTDWSSVDTSGMTPLYNSDTIWYEGAFNALATGHPDYGWGTYDQSSHNVFGHRIFVIKTVNGNYKKIWIKSHITNGSGNHYNFAIGNIDNTDEQTFTVTKSDYDTKSFVYYALDSLEVKDIEPATEDWDLVFRRYQSFLTVPPPGGYYTVSGVLSNPNVSVAEARGVDVTVNDFSNHQFVDDNISIIGSDWKQINMTTNPPSYDIPDSLAYFVEAQDTFFYKIIFTGFAGGATGKSYFSTTKLPPPTVSVQEISNLKSLATYPNPATDRLNTLFTLKNDTNVTINLFDVAGKLRYSYKAGARAGLNNFALNISELSQGFYLLSVDDGNSKLTYKVVKN